MASVADVFAHIYTTENELNSVAVKNGQIILCTDSGKLYIDHVSTRIGISDIIQVENYDALPLAPLDKFYLTRDNGKIYIYVNDRWSLISLDTDIKDAVLRYPATVNSESGVVVITDGTPVTDVRIGDEIVTSDGVYKKVKDSVTIDQPPNGTRIKLSGLTFPEDINGTFILQSEDVWKHESHEYWILKYSNSWLITWTQTPPTKQNSYYYSRGGESDPWSVTTWYEFDGSGSPVLENIGSTTTITDTLDLFEYASLTPDVVKSVNGVVPDNKGSVTIPDATTEASGLLSAADKTKLDSLSTETPEMSVTVGAGLSGKGTSDTPLTLNLSSYQTNTSISLTSTAGAVQMISNTSESALYSSNAFVKANIDIIEMKGNHLKFNSNDENTAGGIVVVDSSTGKIPASIVPETAGSVDLSAYNGLVGITTTGASAISNGASGEYKFTLGTNSNGVILTEDGSTKSITVRSIKGIYLAGGEISIIGYPFKIHSNGKLELSSSQGNIILNAQDSVDANIEMHGTGILWNGAALNTAHGLVQLDASGTVPTSLLPEIGNASWTKVTINQSNFSTDDNTYGGKYMELDGICSVEVYDADGYKVEFDVKCDFTNNKTRVYIPSGLAADTISNWTLLYLAKTIA